MRPLPLALAALAVLVLATPVAAQTSLSAPTRPEPASSSTIAVASSARSVTTGFLQGIALDSVHGGRLRDAKIQLDGTDRVGVTDSVGVFMLDGITPGSYRVLVDHPLLDTLGIALATQRLTFVANEVTLAVVAVPSGESLASRFCAAATQELGPGMIVGRVREADSDLAATGAQVTMTWFDPAPKSLSPRVAALMKQVPRLRETTVGEDGTYRLCGLPEHFEGKLKVQWQGGGSVAEVPVRQAQGVLTLRSVSATRRVAVADSTAQQPVVRGSAILNGYVTNKAGLPVVNARVVLVGHPASAVTGARGDFTLSALPAGTQTLMVRQLGYAPAELPVELSERTPLTLTVKMGAYVPELPTVEVVAGRNTGLDRVGFLGRQRGAIGGFFLTPEQIEAKRKFRVTELFWGSSNIRTTGGSRPRLVSRGRFFNWNGCVTVSVDGLNWGVLGAGELDSFVPPQEVAAIEAYDATYAPVDFASFSAAGDYCASVIVWTKSYIQMRSRR